MIKIQVNWRTDDNDDDADDGDNDDDKGDNKDIDNDDLKEDQKYIFRFLGIGNIIRTPQLVE